jgi:hypothetical protein
MSVIRGMNTCSCFCSRHVSDVRTETWTIEIPHVVVVSTTVTITVPQVASATNAGALITQAVFDIEVVSVGGNPVLFVVMDKGVYRSTNDGVTWSLVDVDRSANNNEVRGITGAGTMIVVNLWREGLWRSTNGGTS